MIKSLLAKAHTGGGIFEVFRFVIVGGLATLTDLLISIFLIYSVPTMHENIVTTIAFFCAFGISYFGHSRFTFQQGGSIVKFFALSLSMLVLRNCIVFLLVTYVMKGIVPIIISMALVTIITFVISKFKIFKAN